MSLEAIVVGWFLINRISRSRVSSNRRDSDGLEDGTERRGMRVDWAE